MTARYRLFCAWILLVSLVASFIGNVACAAGQALDRVLGLPHASLLVVESGAPVIARGADRPMIPASTMKLLTALAAIDRWGLDHRFATRFYLSSDDWLWVEGSGDPYLVSEELDLIVAALKRAGVRSVTGIGIDDALFDRNLRIPGRSRSANPYDAPVSAFAVNFNTIHLQVTGAQVQSAEPQTPLTALGRELGARLGDGSHRINLQEPDRALRYAGELLAAKLAAEGILVGAGQRVGPVPSGARSVATHHNSRDLRGVLVPMLEYSNNFIANQLFLLLGADPRGGSLGMARSQAAMTEWARNRFGWRDFTIEDGAGLSRGNRLSAHQLADVVTAFLPYVDLMPVQPGNSAVRAKTGTLTGVSTYAGVIRRENAWSSFVLLVNQPVDHGLRRQVADDLARIETLERFCLARRCD